MALQPTSNPPRRWYVQVDGQAYGPFDDKQLWAFFVEGRVTSTSVVSNHPNTGYRTVSADPELSHWMKQVPAQDNAQRSAQDGAQTPSAETPVQTETAAETLQAPTPEPAAVPTVFMIMGEIRSGRGMEFLQRLQGLGHVQRLGDTVWLLQASARAETVRDILAQPLSAEDRVFVLDSYANETAWFNLSADMDAQVKTLWDVQRPER